MVIFRSKRIKEEDGIFFVYGGGGSSCPTCGGQLSGYGWRQRIMMESDGNNKILTIRRLYCPACEKIHHELPDILIPYKRHCAETIINIITGNDENYACCNNCTILRILTLCEMSNTAFHGLCSSFLNAQDSQKAA